MVRVPKTWQEALNSTFKRPCFLFFFFFSCRGRSRKLGLHPVDIEVVSPYSKWQIDDWGDKVEVEAKWIKSSCGDYDNTVHIASPTNPHIDDFVTSYLVLKKIQHAGWTLNFPQTIFFVWSIFDPIHFVFVFLKYMNYLIWKEIACNLQFFFQAYKNAQNPNRNN